VEVGVEARDDGDGDGAPVVGAEAAMQYGPPPVAEAAASSEMTIVPN
jgi:hypothetical protein